MPVWPNGRFGTIESSGCFDEGPACAGDKVPAGISVDPKPAAPVIFMKSLLEYSAFISDMLFLLSVVQTVFSGQDSKAGRQACAYDDNSNYQIRMK
jgi:hypothetical protein